MKKLIALLLVLTLAATFVACGNQPAADPTTDPTDGTTEATEEATTGNEEVAVMTYAEFMAAETDSKVCIESNIQANQAWWDDNGQGKVTLYLQDAEGAYFAYEVACTEEESAKLIPGTKVRITGDKAVWSGEIEIMNGTIEFLEGDTFTAEAKDVTELLGTEDLEAEMNKLVANPFAQYIAAKYDIEGEMTVKGKYSKENVFIIEGSEKENITLNKPILLRSDKMIISIVITDIKPVE